MFIGRERQHPASRALVARRRKSEKQVIIGPIKNGSDQWNERGEVNDNVMMKIIINCLGFRYDFAAR